MSPNGINTANSPVLDSMVQNGASTFVPDLFCHPVQALTGQA